LDHLGKPRGVEPRVKPVAGPRRGPGAAQAEAIDGRQPDAVAGRLLRRRDQRFDPTRLACLGAADLHFGARIGPGREVMVEADDAVDVGAAQVERLGDLRLALGIDASERVLHVVQDRQQRALAAGVRGHDLGDSLFPGTHLFNLSACHATCSAMKVEMKKYEWSYPSCILMVAGISALRQASSSKCVFSCVSRKLSAVPWSTSSSGSRAPCLISAQASYCRQAPMSSPRSPPSAFSPHGQLIGLTIGANALVERNRPGLRRLIVSAPWPPIECPVIPWRPSSTGKCSATSVGSSFSTYERILKCRAHGSCVAST